MYGKAEETCCIRDMLKFLYVDVTSMNQIKRIGELMRERDRERKTSDQERIRKYQNRFWEHQKETGTREPADSPDLVFQ